MDVQYKSNMQNVGGYLSLLPNELLDIIERYVQHNDLLYLSEKWLRNTVYNRMIKDHFKQSDLKFYIYDIKIPFSWIPTRFLYGTLSSHIGFRDLDLCQSFQSKYMDIIRNALASHRDCMIKYRSLVSIRTYPELKPEQYVSLLKNGYYVCDEVKKYLSSIGVKFR